LLDPAKKKHLDALINDVYEDSHLGNGKVRESDEGQQALVRWETLTAVREEIEQLRKTVFMTAAHCQGSGSDAGKQASEVLGVPFPIHMPDLIVQAMVEGWDPVEVWPWHPIAKKGAD
jgi:hypothetical protein